MVWLLRIYIVSQAIIELKVKVYDAEKEKYDN